MKYIYLTRYDELVMSLPVRGEWIEILYSGKLYSVYGSLPVRGEWIEILENFYIDLHRAVSPREGRVD